MSALLNFVNLRAAPEKSITQTRSFHDFTHALSVKSVMTPTASLVPFLTQAVISNYVEIFQTCKPFLHQKNRT